MPRLILLLAVVAIVYLLYRRVQSLPPHLRRAEGMKIAVFAALGGVVLLTLAGKMHWIGAAITGLLVFMRQSLPLMLRLFPFLSTLAQNKARAAGATSTVTTEVLIMRLDHESGALSGEVTAGPYAKWLLEEMSREQLQELRSYCEHTDPESVELLDSYLAQRFPGGSGDNAGGNEQAAAGNGSMNRQEALQILGVGEDATRDDIVAAHRKLMQKLHPDRGGNDYLAAKINAAKDFLVD